MHNSFTLKLFKFIHIRTHIFYGYLGIFYPISEMKKSLLSSRGKLIKRDKFNKKFSLCTFRKISHMFNKYAEGPIMLRVESLISHPSGYMLSSFEFVVN